MKRSDQIATAAGYIIVPFVLGACLYWENYVLYWPQFGYWKWVAVSLGVIIAGAGYKPVKNAHALVFAACTILQFAAWAGIRPLPLFAH